MAWHFTETEVVSQGVDELSTVQNYPYGTIKRGYDSTYGAAEFIYLKGVAGTLAGSWVTYDPGVSGVTALVVANAIGPVAIAMGAHAATTNFGWYMITGKAASKAVTASGTVADNGNVYISASGIVDDTIVTGDRVWGAKFASANTTLGFADAEIHRPFVTDGVNSGTS